MKKIFFLLLSIIFTSYSAAYAGERPKEFGGLFWGTHVSKVEGLVLKKESFENLPRDLLEKTKEIMREREERGEKIYVRKTDILKVSGGEVRTIEYSFVKDLLAQVTIFFADYQQYLNFMTIYIRLFGLPDKEEINEMKIQHDWYTKNEDEADVTLFYSSLIKGGFVTMKCKAFLKEETETRGIDWQLFREDEDGKWFYDNGGVMKSDEDLFKVRVKCHLSVQRQNEWRISLKSKIMPRYAISAEEIRCSSKETRKVQYEILSERGPLKSFQQGEGWKPVSPDSRAEDLYNKICK